VCTASAPAKAPQPHVSVPKLGIKTMMRDREAMLLQMSSYTANAIVAGEGARKMGFAP